MRRTELAHLLRAASTITGDPEILLVGSQSILGSFDEDDLPDEAVGSVEADVAFFGPDAGLISPRMHYYDAVASDRTVYVGYIGPHLPTKQTN